MEALDITLGEKQVEGFKENPEIKTPLDTIPIKPELELEVSEGNDKSEVSSSVIGRIKSSAYGGFTKILSTLTTGMSKSDVIIIEKGKLNSISGGGFLYCDLSMLFGENNFEIIDPQYNIKVLRLVTGGDEVVFLNDAANSKYLVSNHVDNNPQITVALAQPNPTTTPKITKPRLGEKVETLILEPEVVSTLQAAAKNLDSQFFILNIFSTEDKKLEIKSISTDNKIFNYDFKNVDNEVTAYKLFNPFPIVKPETLKFELFQNEAGEIWIKTISAIGLANIEYMEKITPMGEFDIFSLT